MSFRSGGGGLERITSLADALGTSPARLVVGSAVGLVLVVIVGWMLAAGPPAPPAGAVGDGALPSAAAESRAGPTTTAPEGSVVHVAGAVAKPGLYRLGVGARVADALHAAGGPSPDADLSLLNLAAPVLDGERVYVLRRGEPPDAAGLVGSGGGGSGMSGGSGARAAPVNLNTATAEQLDALPGVGPATAQAILEWRQQHGRFRKVEDLLNVRGIGPSKLEALRKQVRV